MKKILITGMNRAQCYRDFYVKQEIQVVPSQYSVIRVLEDMGYVVEQRRVSIGEDLSSYDDVIVYLHAPQSFCQNLYSGLYTIAARPDAIVAFDDWQVDQILRSVEAFRQYLIDKDERAFKDYFLELYEGPESREEIERWSEAYKTATDIILSKSNRLLISAFAGGDLLKLKLGWALSRTFAFNPNPYHLNRTPSNGYGEGGLAVFSDDVVSPEDKRRNWNFASLVQKKTQTWLMKQNISLWPVTFYGARRGMEVKQERLKEADMCRVFANDWGCLMPGYFHSGSGWWRARPLQVADAGSILVCDDLEGAVYGEAYVGVRAGDVEQMDLDQLTQLARRQRTCFYDTHPLDKRVTRDEISRVLEASR